MTDHAAGRGRPALPCPTDAVVPPVWGRITNLDVDRGEGSWLITPRRRALPRLLVGDRRHEHRPRPPAGRGRDRRPRPRSSSTASRTSSTTSPGCGCTSGSRTPAAGRTVGRVPVELRRRGGRGGGQARPGRDRPAGDPRRSATATTAGPRQTMALTTAKDVYRGALRAAARAPSTTRPIRTATGRPAAPHAPDGLHLRLGGPARPDVPPVRLPGARRGDHRRAGPRRGRLPRPAAGVPAPPARDHPPARDPAHRRRGPDRLRADRRDVRGPPLGRRAGHPGHGQGHRVGAAAVAGSSPSAELIDRWPPGTHGGTYGGNVVSCAAANATLDVIEDEGLVAQRPRARRPVPRRPARARRRRTRSIGDVRGLGLMVALEFVKPGEGDGRVPDPDLTKRVQAEALARKLIVLTAGHVRERHPDHPAARHDGRRGRPGAGDPRRGAGRRGGIVADPQGGRRFDRRRPPRTGRESGQACWCRVAQAPGSRVGLEAHPGVAAFSPRRAAGAGSPRAGGRSCPRTTARPRSVARRRP